MINELSEDIENIIKNNEKNPLKTLKFVENQTKKIKENAKKISVAPSESGKWINWQSELFLEEKLFPRLFPYGIGGFLSSNVLKKSNMGYSNYIKNRLLSADPKFRNDASYVFFLLLVKELTDMKRSEQTYLRKATKVPNLTNKAVKDIGKEHLFRYNNAFQTYKTIRGTTMYYQDTKKKLMATLRQKGAPTLFTTFSCAEFEWDGLAKSIYETVHKTEVSMDFIQDQSNAWKNKLISENVTQSTLHFSKRTDKIMSFLNKGTFSHDGKAFLTDSYFYRVEFQQRGAPHIHCLLWLETENGEKPPSMWNEDQFDDETLNTQIANFADSVMSGSATDMKCESCFVFNFDCDDCQAGKALVEKFQTHRHTFSCRKKGKICKILSTEGHGRLDNKIKGEELLAPICRLRHPKYPIDKTEFIRAFPSETDENELKEAKKDYRKIKKYLLRLTHDDDFQDTEKWKNFKKMTFNEFLYEVGMFADGKELLDKSALKQARNRYLNALRCEVKSSGMLILRRRPEDILTNNFNKKLIKLHQANIDIQYITDEYAVAEYICNYVTKNESGLSHLLKNINDEAIEQGEDVFKTIKKLGKALDKGREMSIQESIYRSLGLSMTKFSDVVRFVNTNHPDRRDGLLKSNLDELEEEDSIFHNSIHNYYEIRPLEGECMNTTWVKLCLADFVANHNIAYKRQSGSQGKVIQLLDGKSFISQRKKPCVIRYFLKYENEEEYLRALCILFLPFRNEKNDIHAHNVKDLYIANKDLIEENRSRFEKHKTLIDIVEEFENNEENQNEIEEDEPEYIHEETTSEKDIEDFEKGLKAEAKKMLSNFNAGSIEMEEETYLEMINKLNFGQRKIFDDFVERMNDPGNPFYLYIGGEAGTGKSFLLRAMINAAKKIGKHSGAELDKPVCITLAPTGVAAYLVNGTTIESGLGIQPSKDRAYYRNPASRNSQLRFLYADLKCIFLDEVSMCGSDMLAKMNFRIQDIMGNSNFMGGVSVVCTGDFGQLPPVGQKMIWETSYLDSRVEICPNHWDENFKIYYLTEKMRSQDDEFSNICDKVRKGICDNEVSNYLTQHIGECPSENINSKYADGNFCIIVTTNAAREEINNSKLEKLLPNKKAYFANAVDKSTTLPNAPEVSDKLPLTRTGQLQKKLVFKEGAPVMITSNHPKAKYKNNGIVNGSRGFVDSIQPNKEDPDVAEVIWVRFNDDKVGQLLRYDSRALLNQHKPNDKLAVPIVRQKKQFQVRGNTEYMRDQFPLTLCYAVTAHKSQGQTLDEVLIDFSKEPRINNGSFYTALSRVKYGKNLYLKEFQSDYIKANPDVEKKMESMKLFRNYQFKKVYNFEKIFCANDEEIKIGYLNINDLFTGRSLDFLNGDANLLAIDFLVVADSRLGEESDPILLEQKLSNWEVKARFDSADKLKHMGMIVLKSKQSLLEDFKLNIEEKMYYRKHYLHLQILFISFTTYNLETAFVYVRETPTLDEIKMLKQDFINTDLVMGDLNLDPNRSSDLKKIDYLCSQSSKRKRVLTEVTTTRFNQLDHVILNVDKFPVNFSTSHHQHTTDHHAIIIRIPRSGNNFKQAFLERISFDMNAYTLHPKRRKLETDFETKKGIQKQANQFEDLTMDEEIISEETATLNLSCLYSPNWLNDEVINLYMKLLGSINSEVFMFTTFFHNKFSESGFQGVQDFFRQYDLFAYKTIFIPVHHDSHWFLITYDGKELVSYDPYNYPDEESQRREELLVENHKFHMELLENLRDNYWKRLFQKYGKHYKQISLSVQMPPNIPAQNNTFDCGVFLLSFVKCLVQHEKFTFCTDDMIRIRDNILTELNNGRIINLEGRIQSKTKRKRTDSTETPIPRQYLNNSKKQRTIVNEDSQTCWLNSCLQLVLTAFDHMENIAETGTVLWDHFIWMKEKDPSSALDPTSIKGIILQTERDRAVRENILHNRMLFDVGNLPLLYDDGGQSIQRIGQQDCKDFFYCLNENQDVWPDVFSMFKVSTLERTQCVSCLHISQQEVSGDASTFIQLDCPSQPVSMKHYTESKMNGYEQRTGWRDEDGCGVITVGKQSRRIANIEDTEFIIFILSRLMEIDNEKHIIETEVTVDETEKLHLIDANGKSANFSPLSIIYHIGNVVGNTTQGHFMADVRNKNTNSWFRTSDNDPPKPITENGLTKMGYIFLYKKTRTEKFTTE